MDLRDYTAPGWNLAGLEDHEVAQAVQVITAIEDRTIVEQAPSRRTVAAALAGAALAGDMDIVEEVRRNCAAACARALADQVGPEWGPLYAQISGADIQMEGDACMVPAFNVLRASRSFGEMDKLAEMEIVDGRVPATIEVRGALSMVEFMRLLDGMPSVPKDVKKRLAPIVSACKKLHNARERRLAALKKVGHVPECVPPCVARWEKMLATGYRLEHKANFSLAAFHRSIGGPPEALAKKYEESSFYSKRDTDYQLNHVFTHKPDEQQSGYLPYGCANLKLFNLCPDRTCPSTKNPLSEYRRRLVAAKKLGGTRVNRGD